MLMNRKRRHCILGEFLTEEERERVRVLFRQQDIHLEDEGIVARVDVPGDFACCPYRFRIGQGSDYCTSKCYISHVAARQSATGRV